MAAYAALNSVMFILQQIQRHPRPSITIDKRQMESLCGNISFLQEFLENYSHRDMGAGCKEALESRIADAAYAAEDVIESHIVDQILAKKSSDYNFHEENNCIDLFCRGVKKMIRTLACSPNHKTDQILTGDRERSSNSLFCQDLHKIIEDMNIIKKEAVQIQENIMGINDDQLPRSIISMSANIIGSSTVPPPKGKNTTTMVGFDDVLIETMDRLTGHPPNRQVLPIVGMGGIGKTTLARNVYDNPFIVHHFNIRVWVTISQEYRLRDILLEALSCLQNDENKDRKYELGTQLYQSLWGRRYLIILDDMWSIEAWEKLMSFFPENNNGSRIMITTRLSNVSNHFESQSLKLNFLDRDKSWDIFCKIVFPQDNCCPLELEDIGKKIARNCKGLPLSIAVIGGLLANSEKTLEHWEYVAKNLNSMVNFEDDQHCLKILFLSYNHLPVHLKPCFLYMGVYPEDSEISVSQLMRLWVDEGFLKPIKDKSLEMVAEDYLNQLIERNLILIHKLGSSGKVKHCKIHDLLRDLCLREGEKDKFLWVRTLHDFDNLQGIRSQRRISIHEDASEEEFKYGIDRVLEVLSSASLVRSLICNFKDVLSSHSFRLVKVLNMANGNKIFGRRNDYEYSPEDISEFVNLRYLAVRFDSNHVFPFMIHLPWNLQTLIIKGEKRTNYVPPEIWKMSQLRHLEIDIEFNLQYPPNVPLIQEGDDDDLILRNLHTLKTVFNFKLSEQVIKRIPNIKKLGVSYYGLCDEWWHDYCLNNLGLLYKLESLSIEPPFWIQPNFPIEFRQNFTVLHSLKKLSLYGTFLLWEDMRMIGSLPHLQVLKLKYWSFFGPEWNPVEGEFPNLKYLLIGRCNDLVYWNADATHFPCLEKLVLCSLSKLEKIPLDIGHISTLRSIELSDCRESVIKSAKDLLDEQVECGNENLQVQIFCKKNTELESLATHNFQVRTYYGKDSNTTSSILSLSDIFFH